MIIAVTVEDVRKQVKEWKRQGLTVGLVPTMGALHEGHVSLVEASKEQCDRTVASIFVNPTQFDDGADLDNYPRTFDADCEALREHGCDMVFAPTVDVMYPQGFAAEIQVTADMINQLCGASRPGHFKGVCTVVGKLFNIVAPDRAFFGEKDAQQLAIIRKMVCDLNFDVEVVGCATVREADGLAKSSRNVHLNDEERVAARIIYQSFEEARKHIASGENQVAKLTAIIGETISSETLADIDYIKIVDGKTLLPIEVAKDGDLVAVAVNIGDTRLIDNFTIVM